MKALGQIIGILIGLLAVLILLIGILWALNIITELYNNLT